MSQETARIAQVISGCEHGFVVGNVRPDLALVTPEPGLTTEASWSSRMATGIHAQTRGIVERDRFQRLGWECAVALSSDFGDRLTGPQLVDVLVCAAATPDALSAELAGAMIALASQIIGERQ